MMKPYFQEDGITLYHGDCRELLPDLGFAPYTVIVDPVWPNAHGGLVGADDPYGLFSEAVELLPATTISLCVWLGTRSDPRFLGAVPARFPFLRSCYLRRHIPARAGRCLISGDVLYCFGTWPSWKKWRMVLPGENSETSIPSRKVDHPAQRSFGQALWVVKWWQDGVILDPFAGSGTTLMAAKSLGVPAIGIEIEERYCELTVERLNSDLAKKAEEQ